MLGIDPDRVEIRLQQLIKLLAFGVALESVGDLVANDAHVLVADAGDEPEVSIH